jgi:hypothetical protein
VCGFSFPSRSKPFRASGYFLQEPLGRYILYKVENLTFGCEDFEGWFAFGEAFDTKVSEAIEECESKLERYKFSKPSLHVRTRARVNPLLNLYKRKMQNQYVRLNFPGKTFEKILNHAILHFSICKYSLKETCPRAMHRQAWFSEYLRGEHLAPVFFSSFFGRYSYRPSVGSKKSNPRSGSPKVEFSPL